MQIEDRTTQRGIPAGGRGVREDETNVIIRQFFYFFFFTANYTVPLCKASVYDMFAIRLHSEAKGEKGKTSRHICTLPEQTEKIKQTEQLHIKIRA